MLRLLKESNMKIKKTAPVHGEEDQSLAFGDYLKKEGFSAVVPDVGESFRVLFMPPCTSVSEIIGVFFILLYPRSFHGNARMRPAFYTGLGKIY